MKILGADVCKDRVVCWLLDEWPRHLRDYWRIESKKRSRNPLDDELTFYMNSGGIHSLLALQPDAIALEPTGVHYSRLLADVCQKKGIPVLWIGHCEAVHYRKQNKLPDKNDLADALALAAYAHMYWDKPEFFLWFDPGSCTRIRELYLQGKSLTRIQSPIINRIRQQLAYEFPEAALKKSPPSEKDGLSPLWSWLAGRERNLLKDYRYYERLYKQSVTQEYDIEISPFTRTLANMLCDLHLWERVIETELEQLLHQPVFKTYNRVFDKFGIGTKPRALLLSQIYPISRFDSLGGFKRRLGMAGDEVSSGDKIGWNTGTGSKLCRCELYLWVLTFIAPVEKRPDSDIGLKRGKFYDERKARFQDSETWKEEALSEQKHKLGKKVKELVKSIVPNPNLSTELETSIKVFETVIGEKVQPKPFKRGFGNLIISQTAGYACRLLFKELKRALSLKSS